MAEEKGEQKPLACNLGAMTALQRERHHILIEALRQEVVEILELPDGIALHLPPGAWSIAAEFVFLERLCCPFVRFLLELSEDGGPVRLSLTGREGVKDFLRAELGLDSLRSTWTGQVNLP
jgi:hypothetical protein